MPSTTRRKTISPLHGLMRKMKKLSLTPKTKKLLGTDDLAIMLGKISLGPKKRKHQVTSRKTKRKHSSPSNEMDLTGGKRRKSSRSRRSRSKRSRSKRSRSKRSGSKRSRSRSKRSGSRRKSRR